MNTAPSSKAQKNNKAKANDHNKDQELAYLEELIDSNLQAAGKTLQIGTHVLSALLRSKQSLSSLAKYAFLRAIIDHELNPLNEEIILLESNQQDQSAWPFITVDGWIKLINKHPQFCGIEFTYSNEEDKGGLKWIECSIYRKDRIQPINVREYLIEVITDHASWEGLPSRMLRHRTMAQCAKLAFGICLTDYSRRKIPKSESRPQQNRQTKF